MVGPRFYIRWAVVPAVLLAIAGSGTAVAQPGADVTTNGQTTDINVHSGIPPMPNPGGNTPPVPNNGGPPVDTGPKPYQDSSGTWYIPGRDTPPMFVPGGPQCGSANRNPNVQGPVAECAPVAPGLTAAQVAAEGLRVAQAVAAGMQIQPITIGIVPEPAIPVPHTGLIGMPVWLWAANPTENTVGPMTRFATAGAVSVWVTAVLTSVVFSLGDGGIPIPCPQPMLFSPYIDAAMNLPSPACGNPLGFAKTSIHEPGGMFTVTATSAWIVNWVAQAGAIVVGNTFPVTPVGTTPVRVGEVQVLNGPAPPR